MAEALALENYNPSEEIVSPISQEELLREQIADQLCSAIRQCLNGGKEIQFALDEEGILIRLVNESPQIVIPKAVQPRVLHLSHYPKMAGHPCGRKMYYSLRRDFYWPSMPLDCFATSQNCTTCVQKPRPTPEKFQAHEALPSIKTTRVRGH